MLKTLDHPKLHSTYEAIPSKSVAHRALILAAFSEKPTHIICPIYGEDVEATLNCLDDMGARIEKKVDGFLVEPIIEFKEGMVNCRDSATTYRMLEVITRYLGLNVQFTGSKRLLERVKPSTPTSQRLSGKFIARAILSSRGLEQKDTIAELDEEFAVTSSKSYVNVTRKVLSDFGFRSDGDKIVSPQKYVVTGDWSLGAYWLALGTFSKTGVTVSGLDANSPQGDREILDILQNFGAIITVHEGGITVKRSYSKMQGQKIDGSLTPDLVPLIATIACFAEGDTEIRNIKILHYKESDRIETTKKMIRDLGGECETTDDSIIVHGKGGLVGGTVDSAMDHRIAMAAAISSFGTDKAVRIKGSEAVAKSYPNFWVIIDE